jgi:tripartite-type tricarboxylate transporter receptor subunit TctC
VGLAPVNRMAYNGIVAPKNLPSDNEDKVKAATRKVLQDPAIKKRIEETGSLIVADTPEHFFEEIKAEYAVYKDVVQKQNLTMD